MYLIIYVLNLTLGTFPFLNVIIVIVFKMYYKLSLLSYNFNIFRVFVAVCVIFGVHLKMID